MGGVLSWILGRSIVPAKSSSGPLSVEDPAEFGKQAPSPDSSARRRHSAWECCRVFTRAIRVMAQVFMEESR
jgi:hypothetical protein